LLFVLPSCHRSGLSASADTDTPATSTDPQALQSCQQTTLAFTVDHDLRFAFGDGTVRTVYTFATQLPSLPTTFIGQVGDVKGDRLIAGGTTYYLPEGQPGQSASELVLLDLSGNVVWHRAGVGFGTPYLASDGTLAVWDTNEETLVVSTDGSTRAVAGKWSPVAPASDGSLLLQDPPGPVSDRQLGWLRPGNDTVEVLALQPEGYETWIADHLAYIAKQGGTDVLVLATPGESHVVTLPDGTGGLAIAGTAGHYLEVQRYGAMTPTMYRLDVETGAVDLLQDNVPVGMRHFDTDQSTRLTEDGSLLAAFRNDYQGSIYRSTDAGASWVPIGYTVANVQGLGVIAALGGTIVAQSMQGFYAPSSPWGVPPAGTSPELSGKLIELARPIDGVRYQLPALAGYQPVALGNGGRCAAYWTTNMDNMSGKLEVLDVTAKLRATVAEVPDVREIQAPFWLVR
jgi:hypothetical protein